MIIYKQMDSVRLDSYDAAYVSSSMQTGLETAQGELGDVRAFEEGNFNYLLLTHYQIYWFS